MADLNGFAQLLDNPRGLIEEGRAILSAEARAAELERRGLVPDQILALLQRIDAELQMISNRLGALETCAYTPRIRVPVRDDTGRITSVIEKIAEPEY